MLAQLFRRRIRQLERITGQRFLKTRRWYNTVIGGMIKRKKEQDQQSSSTKRSKPSRLVLNASVPSKSTTETLCTDVYHEGVPPLSTGRYKDAYLSRDCSDPKQCDQVVLLRKIQRWNDDTAQRKYTNNIYYYNQLYSDPEITSYPCTSTESQPYDRYYFMKKFDDDLLNNFLAALEDPEVLPARIFHTRFLNVLLILQYINNQGYVHCDVKPENILVRKHEYRLIDFDDFCPMTTNSRNLLACHVGTPGYISESTCRTEFRDLFSVGCILFMYRNIRHGEGVMMPLSSRKSGDIITQDGIESALQQCRHETQDFQDLLRLCLYPEKPLNWPKVLKLYRKNIWNVSDVDYQDIQKKHTAMLSQHNDRYGTRTIQKFS